MSKHIQTINRVLSAPKDERQELMDRTDSELAKWFSSPRGKADYEELAYSILDFAWADARKDDIVSRIIEEKTVGIDEPDFMEEDLRGLSANWQGAGGEIMSDVIRSSRERMPREEMVAAVDLHDLEVQSSFWGSLGKLQAQATEKMRLLPLTKLIQLIDDALPAGSTIDGLALSSTAPAASLADTDVDPIHRAVMRYGGAGVSFVGTQYALHSLADIGLTYGDNVSEQLFRTGVVGAYKGSSVIVVENSQDFFGDDIMPENEIWIVGQNAGRLTYYGNQIRTQVLPRSGFHKTWEFARDAGMSLFGAEAGRLGRIILTD